MCPGLSAPPGHGRKLDLFGVTGQAVLDRLIAFEARPVTARSLIARASSRLSQADATLWAARWKDCLPPPADGLARVERLERAVARWRALSADIQVVDADIAVLLAQTEGQVLTTLPGVKTVRAGAFAAFSMPITTEHRDALMSTAWVSMYCELFTRRAEELATRGTKPMQIRVALARHACRLAHAMTTAQDDFDAHRYRQNRHQTGR